MPRPNLTRIPGDADAEAVRAIRRAPEVVDGPYLRTLDDKARLALGRYGARSPSLALRRQSADVLRDGLLSASIAAAASEQDSRDLMVGFALHFDVAQRLGLEPTAVFDAVAARVAGEGIPGLLRNFGRREDITLSAFGWRCVEADDGPDFEPV